jgi:F-type H+-transporting ATPase subunit b
MNIIVLKALAFLPLMDFNPIKPGFGLLLWTTVIFGLFWLIVGKMAFKPIAEALKKRSNDIQDSLDEAKRAKEEMATMQAENEQLLAKAREERALILKEAKDVKNEIINEAKTKAREEAKKIVTSAKHEIESQKKAAITEVKNQVGMMALDIAEKVIRKELKENKDQQGFVEALVNEIKLN